MKKYFNHIETLKKPFPWSIGFTIALSFLSSYLILNFAALGWKWQLAILLPPLLIILASLSEDLWDGLFIWSLVALIPLDLQVSIWSSEIAGARGLSIHLIHVAVWFNLLSIFFLSPKKISSIAKKERAKILWPLIFLFGLGMASSLWSNNPKLALSQSFIEINGIFIFLVVFYRAYLSGNIRKYLNVFLGVTILEIILGLAQGLGLTNFGLYGFAREISLDTLFLPAVGEVHRPSGTLMGGPTTFAVFLLIVISVCILLRNCAADRKERLLFNFIIIAGSICIFFTYTRVIWVSLVFVLIAIAILEKTLRKRCLLLLTIIVIVSLIMLPSISSRILESAEGGMKVRKDMYKVALSMRADYPLLGVGLNNYPAFRSYYDYGPYYVTEELPESLVHNNFLLYFAELGILGILALSWLFYGGFRIGWRCRSLSKTDFGRLYGTAFIICVFSIFVAGLLQPGPLRSSTGVFHTFLFFAALCCAQCAIERSKSVK